MTDLTQQRNEQIIAPFDCAQDSARQLGSGAEHTSQTAKELLEEGKVSKKKTVTINLFIFYTFISFSFFYEQKRKKRTKERENNVYQNSL